MATSAATICLIVERMFVTTAVLSASLAENLILQGQSMEQIWPKI